MWLREGSLPAAEPSDRAQHFLAMAEQHAKLLRSASVQSGEHLAVDGIVPKRGFGIARCSSSAAMPRYSGLRHASTTSGKVRLPTRQDAPAQMASPDNPGAAEGATVQSSRFGPHLSARHGALTPKHAPLTPPINMAVAICIPGVKLRPEHTHMTPSATRALRRTSRSCWSRTIRRPCGGCRMRWSRLVSTSRRLRRLRKRARRSSGAFPRCC